MTPQKFREFAEKRQKELAKLLRSDLPRLMGTKAMQHFRGNFARGGFLDDNLQAWPSTWRQQALSGADGQRGPLLSRTNTLRNRILFKPAPGRVRIYNDMIILELKYYQRASQCTKRTSNNEALFVGGPSLTA